MKLKVIIVFIMLLSQIMTSFAQDKYETIQDDIDIMETILSKMFNKNNYNVFHNDVTGFYLDEYGVLFEIPFATHKIYHDITINTDSDGDDLIFISGDKKILESKKHIEIDDFDFEKAFQNELEKTKTIITKFLGNYASAISELKPKHWITIIVDFNASYEWIDVLQDGNPAKKFVAKVQKKDISDFHKEKISFENFKNKIQFELKTNNSSVMDEDLDIFKNIIESSLKKGRQNSEYHVKGIYLTNYGAVFMFNTNFEPNYYQIFTSKDNDKNAYSYEVQSYISTNNKPAKVEQKIDKLQDNIIDLMSRFGHTMRKLNNNEWLDVATDINSNNSDISFSKMIFKIKMNDIEKLKQQKINRKDFKQRIKIVKY